jgi:hypothetical protein
MVSRPDDDALSGSGDEQYDPEEAARRRDAVLKIMVNTPPQPRPGAPSKTTRQSPSEDRVRRKSNRPKKP